MKKKIFSKITAVMLMFALMLGCMTVSNPKEVQAAASYKKINKNNEIVINKMDAAAVKYIYKQTTAQFDEEEYLRIKSTGYEVEDDDGYQLTAPHYSITLVFNTTSTKTAKKMYSDFDKQLKKIYKSEVLLYGKDSTNIPFNGRDGGFDKSYRPWMIISGVSKKWADNYMLNKSKNYNGLKVSAKASASELQNFAEQFNTEMMNDKDSDLTKTYEFLITDTKSKADAEQFMKKINAAMQKANGYGVLLTNVTYAGISNNTSFRITVDNKDAKMYKYSVKAIEKLANQSVEYHRQSRQFCDMSTALKMYYIYDAWCFQHNLNWEHDEKFYCPVCDKEYWAYEGGIPTNYGFDLPCSHVMVMNRTSKITNSPRPAYYYQNRTLGWQDMKDLLENKAWGVCGDDANFALAISTQLGIPAKIIGQNSGEHGYTKVTLVNGNGVEFEAHIDNGLLGRLSSMPNEDEYDDDDELIAAAKKYFWN